MDWSTFRLSRRLDFGAETTATAYRLLSEIDSVKKGWSIIGKLQPATITRLTQSVIVTSTGASNRIEGNRLSDEEVEALYQNLRIKKFKTRDEQEVAGYLELLEMIFDNHGAMELSESLILDIHSRMLRHSAKDERHRGNYKFGSNRVEAKDGEGNVVGIIFEPTAPHLVDKEMKDLLAWYEWAKTEDFRHPLLLLGNFLFEFLAIHPFQDGNGRSSRLLTNLLLLKEDYQFAQVVSHEQLVESRKADYYLALNQSQRSWKSDSEDIGPWLVFFLETLSTQAEKAFALLSEEDEESLLSSNQQKILGWAESRSEESFSRKEVIEGLGLPASTVEGAIRKLLALKRVERFGQGRATRYRVST